MDLPTGSPVPTTTSLGCGTTLRPAVELLGVTDDGQAAFVAVRNPDMVSCSADAAGIYRVSIDGDGLDPVRVDLADGSPLVDADPADRHP